MKTLLITGGTGYIGSHAVVAFEEAGYKTIIVDNLSNSSRETLDGIKKILGYDPIFHEGDLRDEDFLETIFGKYDFDGVVHFAGLKAVGESCEKPLLYYDNNIVGSIRLFEAMERHGVRKIIFSSSATVYRSDNIPPFRETLPLGTTNPYGTTKLVIEKILEDLAIHGNWSVTSLRYFNPVGSHPSGYIGEVPSGIPNNLVPYIFDVALGKREYVCIFGDDYETPDGTGVRDYIDVCDLVGAHVLAYQYIVPGSLSFNLGTGKGTSVKEMIDIVGSVAGVEIPCQVSARRSGDIAESYCDPAKAYALLGWEAKTPLRSSIESGYKFISHIHRHE